MKIFQQNSHLNLKDTDLEITWGERYQKIFQHLLQCALNSYQDLSMASIYFRDMPKNELVFPLKGVTRLINEWHPQSSSKLISSQPDIMTHHSFLKATLPTRKYIYHT